MNRLNIAERCNYHSISSNVFVLVAYGGNLRLCYLQCGNPGREVFKNSVPVFFEDEMCVEDLALYFPLVKYKFTT